MKSVKTKLFIFFSIVIFMVLLLLSFISIELFTFNQKNTLYEKMHLLMAKSYAFVQKRNDTSIAQLDRFINTKNNFVIVQKDNTLLYSSESSYKTNRIIEEVNEEFEQGIDDLYPKQQNKSVNVSPTLKSFEEDEFIILYDIVQKNQHTYALYIGIEDATHELRIEDIIVGIYLFNISIFFILVILGYVLINNTIKPLKNILGQLKHLEKANDFSKRITVHKSNDEFETLALTFNEMLDNIEKSVDNIKQFSSDASHELKTPLTVIQGQIELCQKKSVSMDELKSAMYTINHEQKKLQEIIQNFLLLSRLDKESILNEKSSLDSLMFDVIENNLFKLESKNLELQLDIEENVVVNFNGKYLLIVLNNLMSNAIKYTNTGFIKISIHQKEKTILEIADSGVGIKEDDLEKIFERFFRVDKARSQYENGIGLGLAIVKKICNHFHATISVKSVYNKGTRFIIEFE